MHYEHKLTLKLNKSSIEKAKRNKQSHSFMVENYFNLITEDEKESKIEISPNMLELSGIISLPDDFNLKKEYGEHLEDKYLK